MSSYYCLLVALLVVCLSSTVNCQEPPRTCQNTGPTCIEECPSNDTNWYQWCGSCSIYIRCVDSARSFQSCPSTYVFNDVVKLCTAQSPICRECIIDTPPPPTDITVPISPTTPPAVPALCESTGSLCISGCRGTTNGAYQWCGRCDYYLYCQTNLAYYLQCAPGKVWDQREVGCVTPPSSTCSQCVTAAPSTTTTSPMYDYCADEPCDNNADCVADENGFTCICQPGYTGVTCDSVIQYCSSEPCLNGGTCYDGIGVYVCVCPPTFSGTHCELYVELSTTPFTTPFTSPFTTSFTTPFTTLFTTTTTRPTAPPYAPNIYPDPYIAVLLNGYLTTSDVATMQCSDSISVEFRDSYQSIVNRVNDAINRRQMCVDSGGTLNVFAGQIQFNFVGNNARVQLTVMVGVNPSDTLTVRADEYCASEVTTFIQDFDNWRQPIIPFVYGCPTTTFNSPSFDWLSTSWSCI